MDLRFDTAGTQYFHVTATSFPMNGVHLIPALFAVSCALNAARTVMNEGTA